METSGWLQQRQDQACNPSVLLRHGQMPFFPETDYRLYLMEHKILEDLCEHISLQQRLTLWAPCFLLLSHRTTVIFCPTHLFLHLSHCCSLAHGISHSPPALALERSAVTALEIRRTSPGSELLSSCTKKKSYISSQTAPIAIQRREQKVGVTLDKGTQVAALTLQCAAMSSPCYVRQQALRLSTPV